VSVMWDEREKGKRLTLTRDNTRRRRKEGREGERKGRTYVVELGDVVGSTVVLVLGRGDLTIGL